MSAAPNKPVLLLALGGNALIPKGGAGTLEEQFATLRSCMGQVADLARDYRIIITHGNGPQVGDLLLRQECCSKGINLPLEILVAQTQGWLGYMIESTLDSEFMARGNYFSQKMVSLISYVVVNPDDPAFAGPSKPIGPVLTPEQARAAAYPVRVTAKGPRRVVASPEPVTIVEKREIKTLIKQGFIVICCGGGGIPVIREGRTFAGVDAVIDKDLASARLAVEVGVDIFVIATDVEGAALDYGTEQERFPRVLSIAEARAHQEAGQFPPGSMGPKVESCVRFLEDGGKRAVITSTQTIGAAVAGKAGTEITP